MNANKTIENIFNLITDDDGFSIARRSCRVAGESGTCMFVWECLKTEGKHLGMCMDGFMFGSCCVHNEDQNKVSISNQELKPTSTTSTTPRPTSSGPTRPARPEKPQVKWPNFHLVDQNGNEEKEETQSQHFVSIKAPQDPRPGLKSTTTPR